eukprot:CAMPEP_0182888806 /NCGR_PEP_ID=MMETSP0034_2-20130328/21663_1 /TAXON_ID=156128 /ORGANISM="Nephroselmis pyriformis, Strain CCMP717" /LENGTH=86 /DNA_ID=CAMNT_0025022261 /DNA_START=53 /DNA_END=314 /DNA_ORIENTATION=-
MDGSGPGDEHACGLPGPCPPHLMPQGTPSCPGALPGRPLATRAKDAYLFTREVAQMYAAGPRAQEGPGREHPLRQLASVSIRGAQA